MIEVDRITKLTNDLLGNEVERSALQAFWVFRLLYSSPDGIGYLNGCPFGPEDRSLPSVSSNFELRTR